MKPHLLDLLVCPACQCRLTLEIAAEQDGEIEAGTLHCGNCGTGFPIRGGTPRFVSGDEYANSFCHQWRKYRQLQLDSYNGTTFSHQRFYSITEWSPSDLKGRLVLDAGCGAGRFSEVALDAGADVVAVELTAAVDVCRANLGKSERLHCVQASLYHLPFRRSTFDAAFCIGVIQHTPSPRRAVEAVVDKVKPSGKIALWVYELSWKSFIGTTGFKYLLRPITKAMVVSDLERFSAALESLCWPINRAARHRRRIGKAVMRLLPVCSASLHGVPLSADDFREWVRLDTFDMYSPAYDKPQRFSSVKEWLESCQCAVDRRHPHGAIAITATKQ
jgi:2-polyprenyl-3-methyl-5-hydroxy-6-metoxy-1,4-benzoquinol methylase